VAIQFKLNGTLQVEEHVSPSVTVLDYLREYRGLTGTKEGCGEGDCGACTITLVRKIDNDITIEAVNSCLLILPQIDGCEVMTVEGLDGKDGRLDPVQDAMVVSDGTQCGFCTPGFIMSMYALCYSGEQVTKDIVHDALAGNLCRCTGYRPIVEAAYKASVGVSRVAFIPADLSISEEYEVDGQKYFTPRDIAAFSELYSSFPDAYVLAGGTELGLLPSKERQQFSTVIHTGHVAELNEITETDMYLELGAAVTYTRILPYIDRLFPSFATLIKRIGSRQIRNVGTLGGNIGNASPIGDTPPCLIALDATLVLYSDKGEREIPIEEFFLDYRKTDLVEGEFIKSIRIPKLTDLQFFRVYKISKRYDQDISAVIGAFRVGLQVEKISDIRIAYGGMAATPKRASSCEVALKGNDLSEITALAGAAAIMDDYAPIDDHRASKKYRITVAGNLLIRLYRDLQPTEEQLEVVNL